MQNPRLNPWFFVPYLLLLIAVGSYLLMNPKGAFLLWLNQHHTDTLDTLFMTTNALGEWIFASVVVAALIVFTSYASALAAVLSWVLSGLATQVLKHFIFEDVVRPYRFFKDLEELYFVPGVAMSQHHSFPSGHTTVAFALCTVLALSVANRAWGLLFITMAAVAGLSRIYLAQHFLVDTYFGSLIGTLTGIIVYALLQRYLAQRPAHVLHRNALVSLKA